MSRFHSSAGIAIGPILFVIAILGVMAVAMSNNMGNFTTIGIADRVTADITSQANLIRTKFSECAMRYGTTVDNNYGYSAGSNTLVSAATCAGIPAASPNNLWTGLYQAFLPPPTQGFNEWRYTNAGPTGGRCFWTTPISGNSNPGIVEGLKKVKTKYSKQEVNYVEDSTQKIIFFLTLPTGTPNADCPPAP